MSEEQVQDEVQTQTEVNPVESEARLQGWVPKEEFRGNESDWIDADTFVQRGREINPILRKNNERIQRELDATKRQMEELKKATDEFKKFQKESFDRKLHEYEVEIQDLKTLKKKAVSEGDGDLVVELDDRIDELKAKKAEETFDEGTPAPAPVDPAIQQATEDWMDANSWYKSDKNMQVAADSIAVQIRKENPYLVGKEFFEKVDNALVDLFPPEKLGKKVRPRNPVEGSKPSSDGKTKQAYDSLPPEAKAACDKFVKQKLMTKDEYVKMYFE